MTVAPSPSRKHGIAILANDRVIKWLLPFLESYRATNAALPLYLIPFDDNLAQTRRAADVYGATVVKTDMGPVDALAKRLYPLYPLHRRRLRKLMALSLPLDKVIYVDVDTILFRDFRRFFGKLEPGKADFIIASTSGDYVYNSKSARHDFLRDVEPFNDGFFLTSNKILSLDNFLRIAGEEEKLFHAVRKRGMLFAQPLVNFVVHRLGLKVRSLSQCYHTASSESFYKAESVTFREDGPVDCSGGEIFFAHWAGSVRAPSDRVFDGAWQKFSDQATLRVQPVARIG